MKPATGSAPHAPITIPARFNGPPRSANGGWTGGSLARRLGAPAAGAAVSVALRAPVPLERPLAVQPGPDGRLLLLDDGQLLAEAGMAPDLDDEALPPAWPDVAAAEAAGALGRLRQARRGPAWPYARCFVCGGMRGDGLGLMPGPVEGDSGLAATTWVPDASVADGQGEVLLEAVWAALDCPAGIAWGLRLGDGTVMVTANITAQQRAPLQAGARYRVLGWPIRQDGRKLHAGTAIVDDGGVVHAVSHQLWLTPRAA